MMKLLAPLALLAPAALTGQAITQSDEGAIDAVFAAYDAPDVPGAAVAVIREGEIIYSKAFGSAQLEYGIPVEPTTPFHVASVSKQFTAMAVLLLVDEGRIDLDEDLRTYLDWVPELPAVVTPRHLLSHTSGIRDQWELLMTAGWRLDDVITKEQVRRLMMKQRQLNFRPGTRQLYSNMGFSLAAELVQEVSGQPFDEFVKVRILEPLGMERTHVHDDHQHMVPGRAYSYRPDGDGYANGVLSYANHGATSLFTTAEDLVVWLDNYRTGTVGGAMLDVMTMRTVLANGDTIANALGLFIDDYRGRSRIQHGGADAGFRSFVAWFPEDEVGIAVVSNLAATDAGGLANAVTDVVLESVLEPVEADDPEQSEQRIAVPEEPAAVDPATLERYAGAYTTDRVNFAFEVRDGALWLTQPEEGPLVPVTEVAFVTDNGIARFEFEVEGGVVT
ncbi:MAG TPA: serine hydrolase domain-containing protein, partial [Longimicrobiales bacterium]|nr:serine hydrolase domain-containing protein [Longimicrobiales bacterium]